MSDHMMDQIRDANPFPSELPAPPIEEVWSRLETNPAPDARTAHGTGSSPGPSGSERFGGARRRGRHARIAGFLVPVVSVLVVAFVVVALLGTRGSRPGGTTASGGVVDLVYQALPTPQTPVVTRSALQRTIETMRARLLLLGVASAHVSVSGTTKITVGLPAGSYTARGEREIGMTAQLLVYDWEANVLAPNATTVASRLQSLNPTALQISQGSGSRPPGSPGAGSMGLYQAVLLASKQPATPVSTSLSRKGPEYYMFGAPGSAACATAPRDRGQAPAPGVHCLLSGPDDNKAGVDSGLPAGVTRSRGQILAVKQGTVVVEAISRVSGGPLSFSDPNAQFFVLRDNVALWGNEITNPQSSTDPNSHQPDLTFGVTSKAKTAFQTMTATIAHRGNLVSTFGQTLNQHFAVALDGQLVAVPYIDYKVYPDGVTTYGADLSSGLTSASTRSLAAALRLGASPLSLKLICGAPAATACPTPRSR